MQEGVLLAPLPPISSLMYLPPILPCNPPLLSLPACLNNAKAVAPPPQQAALRDNCCCVLRTCRIRPQEVMGLMAPFACVTSHIGRQANHSLHLNSFRLCPNGRLKVWYKGCWFVADLERVCGPDCILSSNTSTIDIDLIGQKTKAQDRIVGAHFFSPAHIMPLLEIVRTEKTSKQVQTVLTHTPPPPSRPALFLPPFPKKCCSWIPTGISSPPRAVPRPCKNLKPPPPPLSQIGLTNLLSNVPLTNFQFGAIKCCRSLMSALPVLYIHDCCVCNYVCSLKQKRHALLVCHPDMCMDVIKYGASDPVATVSPSPF